MAALRQSCAAAAAAKGLPPPPPQQLDAVLRSLAESNRIMLSEDATTVYLL